tara:strand:- start:66 stop:653 length:588 start_codon:yes stop_codon:yes gene_type:complete
MSLILVICGPAGVGKTTVCDRLLEKFGDQLTRVITTTTRKPRLGEKEGQDYFFTTVKEFKGLLGKNAFLEHELIHGNYYGTRKENVFGEIRKLRNILINIDVKGARNLPKEILKIRDFNGKIVSVFLKPSNLEVLKKRLFQRASDSKVDIEARLQTAKKEISIAENFDHIIISKDKESDYISVEKIYLRYLKSKG